MPPRVCRLLAGALALSLAAPLSARADDEACFGTAIEGQKLQRAGKLVAAREKFVACAQATCPSAVADKCSTWLADVARTIPSLTVAVRDERGRDVVPDRVRIDGADAAAAAGGRAIEVDPGVHDIAIEVHGGALSHRVVMREGERSRPIAFELAPPAAEPPPRRAPSPAMLYGAIAAGGVAIVSGGVFAAFAAKGLADRSAYGCADGCSSDPYDRVRGELRTADIALGIAAGSLAIAVVLFVARPTAPHAAAAASPRPRALLTF